MSSLRLLRQLDRCLALTSINESQTLRKALSQEESEALSRTPQTRKGLSLSPPVSSMAQESFCGNILRKCEARQRQRCSRPSKRNFFQQKSPVHSAKEPCNFYKTVHICSFPDKEPYYPVKGTLSPMKSALALVKQP